MPRKPSKPAKAPKASKSSTRVEPYEHSTPKAPLRPDVGTQAQFKKKLPPKTYRYDSSLNPALDWDNNPVRTIGEALIKKIQDAKSIDEAKAAAAELRRMSKPFLNWAGKAERLSFEVPTLPLFIHERLSTQAILETLKSHRRDKQESFFDDLFKDPRHSVTEQVLRAYEHQDDWVNRLVMGDSLVVLNSLLHYENMGGKVQMIYMDPPYGVKFGSNFQPFVRKREVGHGVDEEMTREPEMVQAYRDTWELGLHSYLAYLRDRLVLCRELLSSSGSVFVQIGEENLHHVRELMDEVLGNENYVSTISVKKTATPRSLLDSSVFYVIWYAKDAEHVKYNPLFVPKPCDEWARDTPGGSWGVEINGKRRPLTPEEKNNTNLLPAGAKVYCLSKLTSAGAGANDWAFEIDGKQFKAGPNAHWKTTQEGMQTLIKAGRIEMRDRPWFVRFHSDYVVQRLTNIWEDTAGKAAETVYVVQTQPDVVQRCILMTTDPGDLVIDPTCGSGTTALAAELWGRRWITCDVSRVPLALARQRLLTATYPFHELKQPDSGPAGGFVYKRKKNSKGEDVGGIIPHITLGSIANNEPEEEVVIVDRPETQSGVMRVTGPFTFEATIPTALDPVSDQDKPSADDVSAYGSYVDRMIEVLKKSPVLQLPGKKSVTFKTIRVPAKTLSLSAEATVVNGKERPCALVFGPENGAVSERMVHEAAREAAAKKYEHLYVIAFAIQPNARELVEHCDEVMGIPATYVQATPDLLMGDLLKNMRSSQIFSVCGLPEISVKKAKGSEVTVKLLGLDVFDPVSMETHHRSGGDVPAWFLDSDYNGLSFHVTQAFFPRTQAWDNLKKALKADFDESAWDHLAGSESAPFEPGEHRRIAVKVIDDRGNELMVVQDLK